MRLRFIQSACTISLKDSPLFRQNIYQVGIPSYYVKYYLTISSSYPHLSYLSSVILKFKNSPIIFFNEIPIMNNHEYLNQKKQKNKLNFGYSKIAAYFFCLTSSMLLITIMINSNLPFHFSFLSNEVYFV